MLIKEQEKTPKYFRPDTRLLKIKWNQENTG